MKVAVSFGLDIARAKWCVTMSDKDGMYKGSSLAIVPAILPDGDGGGSPCPDLMTEEELIVFLRIPQVSNARDYRNVIENLKRMHDLPRIHICGKPLYPREAVSEWIRNKTQNGQ